MGHIGGFMAVCQTVDVLDRKPMSVCVCERIQRSLFGRPSKERCCTQSCVVKNQELLFVPSHVRFINFAFAIKP